MKRKLLFALAVLAVIGWLSIALVFAVEWALARPVQMNVGPAPNDLGAESIEFGSESGAIVHGWWCPIENSRDVVLLLPGIRANRLSMVERARFLRRSNYSVLLIDFQATGETKGEHITFGWKESRDVLAAVDFIREHAPASRIGIIGSSLGGAAALLATPPLKVDALVLEQVYPTIVIATRNRLENYLGPLGSYALPLLLSQLRTRIGISPRDLRPIDHIKQVSCPVLIIAGALDRNTRPADTKMLYDAAPRRKEMWTLYRAGHIDLHRAATAEYEKRVLAFLDQMANSQSP